MTKWDRIQKTRKGRGETTREYSAFQGYLKLGPSRSLAKAVAALLPQASTTTLKTRTRWFEKLSKKWRWVDRAAAYDEFIEGESRKEYLKRRKELERRRAESEFNVQDLFEKRLRKMDELADKAGTLPLTDVEQVTTREVPGGGTEQDVRKVKGHPLTHIAALNREMRETAASTIIGFRPAVPGAVKPASPSTATAGTFRYVKTTPKKVTKPMRDKRDD